MPYKVFPEGGKFCVYKHDASGVKVGSSLGCHPSRKDANGQLRALYANETKEMLASKGIQTGIKAFERDGKRLMVLWTSNAFEDREQEIFKTKAWEDYVARHDASGDGYGPVIFWHVKGTEFADVVYSNMVGRILLEVAQFRDTAFADKMFHAITHPGQYPEVLPLGWGTSHGYAYRLGDKHDGVYDFVEKFETTVLPYHRASNLWGGIKEVMDMARTKEKDEALAKLVGQDEAEKQLQGAEKATSVLEQAGISFKEDGEEDEAETQDDNENPEEEAEDAEPEEDGEDEADDQLFELEVTDDLVKEIAQHVKELMVAEQATGAKEAETKLVTSVKEAVIAELTPTIQQAVSAAMTQLKGEVQASKEATIQQALSGKIRLSPWSASHSTDTEVPEGQVAAAKEAKTKKGQQDVVSNVVSMMLAGKS